MTVQVKYNKNEKELIKQSSSYKIGRMITWLSRKMCYFKIIGGL